MSLVSPSQSNPGDTIDASDINNPINQIAAVVNGGIDSTNIANNAVTPAKTTFMIKSTDVNGWTVYDYGTWKTYSKRVTFSVTKVSGEYFTVANPSLPVGITTIGTNYVKATLSCNFADDSQHGLKVSLTTGTSLPYGMKFLASATFIGWVDYEIQA